MTPTHSRKDGKLYRYYIATSALRSGLPDASPIRRIPASEIEAAVVGQIKRMAQSPEIVVATWRTERINESYVTRLIRLNLLAPDIVDAALNGQTQFTVQDLTEPISPIWIEQRIQLASGNAT